jgi:NosR/NirI family nitrous oxide reductase transcriptional regulator
MLRDNIWSVAEHILKDHKFTFFAKCLLLLLLSFVATQSFAMTTVTDAQIIQSIEAAVPGVTHVGEKLAIATGKTEKIRQIMRGDELAAIAFETVDVVDIPAYSGKPVNVLVVIDTEGKILTTRTLSHHEPILLVGIPEQKLFDFVDLYQGLMVTDRVRVGSSSDEKVITVDAISGATVTVMVVNEAIMRASKKVAKILHIAGLTETPDLPPATIKKDVYEKKDWDQLTGDGSVRRLALSYEQVDQAFVGSKAQWKGKDQQARAAKKFIELYYAPLNIPTIGRNLLGDSEYNWLMKELHEGDQAIAVFGGGDYSFKGNGYVRGGIFDRTQLQQSEKIISFHDTDYYRLDDVYIDGFPGFKEKAIFIIRNHYQFDHGTPWQLELLVRRQVGALDSVFASFIGDYTTLENYIDRPDPVIAQEPEIEPLWISVWKDRSFQIVVLTLSLGLLFIVIFLQDWFARYPTFLHTFRRLYLVYTVVFIGWYTLGQLSVVNVFTFVRALKGDFHWEVFLLDPMLFIMWGFVALTLLLWGRGVFCGWLCPFGALQELINELARKLKVKQFELPFAVHERLWALKYVIFLGLFAISLESLNEAERFAEIEPFKTSFLLKFNREWGYVVYAISLLLISIFTRKVYCRYICPLGAALAIPSQFRLFDWLKRRKECGQPCKVCANECEIQAIHPDGHINGNECHQCLDCQVTYYRKDKCPPLVLKERKRIKKEKYKEAIEMVPVVEERSELIL